MLLVFKILTVLLGVMIYFELYTARTRGGCRRICMNGGTCTNGTCACAPGWSGEFCTERKISKSIYSKFVYYNYVPKERIVHIFSML